MLYTSFIDIGPLVLEKKLLKYFMAARVIIWTNYDGQELQCYIPSFMEISVEDI